MVTHTVCCFSDEGLMELLDRLEVYEDEFFERKATDRDLRLVEEHTDVYRQFDSKEEAENFYNFMANDYDRAIIYDHEKEEWYD